MQELIVQAQERGQRLDKYLRRHLPLAPSSFLYKMLRKKNITLRGKKADGSEKVEEGDAVILFLSEETIRKFSVPEDGARQRKQEGEADRAYRTLTPLLGKAPVLYEDEDILLVAKPPGVLSQKATASDLSVNEWLRGYLRRKASENGDPQEEGAPGICGTSPSVCNRLDRNTGGILLCARSLSGSRMLSGLIRDRKIRKTYRMLVHGRITEPGRIEGDLVKDRARNHVFVAGTGAGDYFGKTDSVRQTRRTEEGGPELSLKQSPEKDSRDRTARLRLSSSKDENEQAVRHAVTLYRPVFTGEKVTLVEADLITGRSHQLRVHMASIGHPVVGDPRYGNRALDRKLWKTSPASVKKNSVPERAGTRPAESGRVRGRKENDRLSQAESPGSGFGGQLLWCTAVTFPDLPECGAAAGRTFSCPEPAWWEDLLYGVRAGN